MEIVGIEINGVHYLPYRGKDNSSGYFRSFIHYCIDRYFDQELLRLFDEAEKNHSSGSSAEDYIKRIQHLVSVYGV